MKNNVSNTYRVLASKTTLIVIPLAVCFFIMAACSRSSTAIPTAVASSDQLVSASTATAPSPTQTPMRATETPSALTQKPATKATPSPAPTEPPVTATLKPAPKAEKPALIVKETNEAMKALHRYKANATMTITFSGTPTVSHMFGEIDGQNSYAKWGNTEYLTYNGKSYKRASDKAPWKLDTTDTTNDPSTGFLGDIKQPAGTSLILYDKTLCQVITGDTTDKDGQVTHYKIWIGLLDHFVRRYDMDSKYVQATITFYGFNVPISIKGPSSQ